MPPDQAARIAAEAIRAGCGVEAQRIWSTDDWTVVVLVPSRYDGTYRAIGPLADYAAWWEPWLSKE